MVLPSRPVHYLAPMVAFAAIILLLFHLLVFPTPTSPFPTTTSTSTTKTLTLIPKAKPLHRSHLRVLPMGRPDRMPTLQGRQQVEAQLRLFFDPRTRGGFRLRGRWGGARQRAGQGWTWIPTTSTPAAAGSPASTTSTPATAGSPASVPSPFLADGPN
ncbi:40S ribosomal protein S12-like [Iris pallida]|uniref:40S ribosomal protein S12-like n=1 Tax=Iris pallida TaxID=29817 RepID=A0AAX6FBT4_IRIPA|nr:40S ribosomal protein S12-like [Iris pallida]